MPLPRIHLPTLIRNTAHQLQHRYGFTITQIKRAFPRNLTTASAMPKRTPLDTLILNTTVRKFLGITNDTAPIAEKTTEINPTHLPLNEKQLTDLKQTTATANYQSQLLRNFHNGMLMNQRQRRAAHNNGVRVNP